MISYFGILLCQKMFYVNNNFTGPHTVEPDDGTIKDLREFFVNAGFSANPEQRAYEYYKPYLGNTEWVSYLNIICVHGTNLGKIAFITVIQALYNFVATLQFWVSIHNMS